RLCNRANYFCIPAPSPTAHSLTRSLVFKRVRGQDVATGALKTAGTNEGGARSVRDVPEAESVRRGEVAGGGAVASTHDRRHVPGAAPPHPDVDHGPHDRTHHLVAEGGRL